MKTEEQCVEELASHGWAICDRFSCDGCPIEANCPFEHLINAESEKVLNEEGILVLQGPGGMWGTFRKYEDKLRMVDERDWPVLPGEKVVVSGFCKYQGECGERLKIRG